ncbi:MAG: response regulator transcription factor [Phototrophicaceae bacterium]
MLVDDHDMVRLGLRTALQELPHFDIVAEAKNGKTALALYSQIQTDIILMDLLMPDMDGIATATSILSYNPNAKIIALTSYEDDNLVESAVNIGIKGYVLKHINMATLEKVILDVYEGKLVYGQEAAEALIRINQSRSTDDKFDLTPSQLKVLRLLVEGMSNREIADELVVSLSTAKKHVSDILFKLDVNNRAEAAVMAIRHKLV